MNDDLSLGSQLVKTVRSLLSLMLSHGMSSSSADRDMAFTLSSRLNTLQNKGKINRHLATRQDPVWSIFLTCQLPGTDPEASSRSGPGQSAANGWVCFWVQWTLGFSQRLHTCKPGWYTLRSGRTEERADYFEWGSLLISGFEGTRVSDLHLSG